MAPSERGGFRVRASCNAAKDDPVPRVRVVLGGALHRINHRWAMSPHAPAPPHRRRREIEAGP